MYSYTEERIRNDFEKKYLTRIPLILSTFDEYRLVKLPNSYCMSEDGYNINRSNYKLWISNGTIEKREK